MPRTASIPKPHKALPYFNYNDVPDAWFTIDEMCFYCNLVEKVLLQLIEQLGYASKLKRTVGNGTQVFLAVSP